MPQDEERRERSEEEEGSFLSGVRPTYGRHGGGGGSEIAFGTCATGGREEEEEEEEEEGEGASQLCRTEGIHLSPCSGPSSSSF